VVLLASIVLKAVLLFAVVFLVFESGFLFGRLSSQEKANGAAMQSALSFSRLSDQKLSSTIDIVSVTNTGTGEVDKANVEIVPNGQGRVLFAASPFVEPDTQQSLETAAAVASVFSQKSLSGKDVIYSVTNTSAELIGGPSAGAAFTVATIAAIEGKTIRQDTTITGTIEEDGSVGQVGGIVEKLNAAAEQGKKLFLVPEDQSIVVTYTQQLTTRRQGGFVYQVSRLVPKQVDLNELAAEQGIEVKEVSNIQEAVELLLE
jgi:predicted S18 family serine protease